MKLRKWLKESIVGYMLCKKNNHFNTNHTSSTLLHCAVVQFSLGSFLSRIALFMALVPLTGGQEQWSRPGDSHATGTALTSSLSSVSDEGKTTTAYMAIFQQKSDIISNYTSIMNLSLKLTKYGSVNVLKFYYTKWSTTKNTVFQVK